MAVVSIIVSLLGIVLSFIPVSYTHLDVYKRQAYTAQTSYLYRLHGENTFLSIHAEGVRENRVVWLEFYRAVQRGEIGNPVILGNPKYMEAVSYTHLDVYKRQCRRCC